MWDRNDPYLSGMTLKQVAGVLRLSYPLIHHIVTTSGKIEAVRVCGTWLCNPESVRRYKDYLDAKKVVDENRRK